MNPVKSLPLPQRALKRCLISEWEQRDLTSHAGRRKVPGVNTQEEERNVNYLSEMLSWWSLRELCLRLTAGTLIFLFMQHGRVLGNGSIGVQWKSSCIQRPFKEQYILQGELRGKPKSVFFIFWDRVSLCFPGRTQTPGLQRSSCWRL